VLLRKKKPAAVFTPRQASRVLNSIGQLRRHFLVAAEAHTIGKLRQGIGFFAEQSIKLGQQISGQLVPQFVDFLVQGLEIFRIAVRLDDRLRLAHELQLLKLQHDFQMAIHRGSPKYFLTSTVKTVLRRFCRQSTCSTKAPVESLKAEPMPRKCQLDKCPKPAKLWLSVWRRIAIIQEARPICASFALKGRALVQFQFVAAEENV
jgi:hypothetical protein